MKWPLYPQPYYIVNLIGHSSSFQGDYDRYEESRLPRQLSFLPKTEFPMRGSLPQQEPKLLERWQKMGLV